MLLAETNLMDTISFWGGLASIVALALTLIGGLIALYRMLSKSTQAELERLETAQKELAERTKAATTQGKRMDLFIYQQSIFSSLRFRFTILEISVATSNITGLLFLIFVFTLDRNADYAADHVFAFGNNWRDHYFIVWFISIVLVVSGIVSTRKLLRRQRRRLDALSTTFISELGKIVDNTLPVDD